MTTSVCLILDVGVHMAPDITEAMECLKLLVQRKFFSEKKEELALVLCGTAATNDDANQTRANITLVRELSPIDWDVLEFLNSESLLSTEQGDLMDALAVGSQHLISRCKGRKDVIEMRLIIVSNLGGPANKLHVKAIFETLSSADIRLSMIGHHLSNEDVNIEPHEGGPSNHYPQENGNLKLRPSLATISELWTGLDGESFTFSDALPALAYFETRSVAQRGWKVDLQIGNDLSIPTEGFSLVREARPPTLKLVYAANPSIPIKSSTTYHTQDGEGKDLEPSQLVRGYRYGGTVLSLSEEDMLAMKPDSEKCLTVIGFTDAANVPSNLYVGDSVLAFVPTSTTASGSQSGSSLAALAQALFELNMVAVVRRVYNRISAPRLGVLAPEIRDNQVILLYTDIAFAEDVRNIIFPSLPLGLVNSNHPNPSTSSSEQPPSESQLKSMESFIDCMVLDDLSSDTHDQRSDSERAGPDGDREESQSSSLQLEHVPNPWIQRLFSCFRQRGLNQPLPGMGASTSDVQAPRLDPRNLPGFEPVLSRLLVEDQSGISDARHNLVQVLPQLFPARGTKDEDSDSAVSSVKRRRLMLNELFGLKANKPEQDQVATTSNICVRSSGMPRDQTDVGLDESKSASDAAYPTSNGIMDPVEEFHNHISQQQASVACERLRQRIIQFVTDPYLGSFLLPKAVACLIAFRDSAVRLANALVPDLTVARAYNDFLLSWQRELQSPTGLTISSTEITKVDDPRSSFWKTISSQGLGFLTDSEIPGLTSNGSDLEAVAPAPSNHE